MRVVVFHGVSADVWEADEAVAGADGIWEEITEVENDHACRYVVNMIGRGCI